MASANRQNLVSKKLHTRVHQGKVAFPHAVTVEGKRMIFLSGQLAWDAAGNVVGKGDMRAQIRQVCENLTEALTLAGATWEDVVKTSTFVTDLDALFKNNDVRQEYFGRGWPASTTVQVSRLANPDMMIETRISISL